MCGTFSDAAGFPTQTNSYFSRECVHMLLYCTVAWCWFASLRTAIVLPFGGIRIERIIHRSIVCSCYTTFAPKGLLGKKNSLVCIYQNRMMTTSFAVGNASTLFTSWLIWSGHRRHTNSSAYALLIHSAYWPCTVRAR